MFKIEPNIPIPDGTRRRIWIKELFDAMTVGDSFVIPADDKTHSRCVSVTNYAREGNLAIKTRRQPDNSYRVWLLSRDKAGLKMQICKVFSETDGLTKKDTPALAIYSA